MLSRMGAAEECIVLENNALEAYVFSTGVLCSHTQRQLLSVEWRPMVSWEGAGSRHVAPPQACKHEGRRSVYNLQGQDEKSSDELNLGMQLQWVFARTQSPGARRSRVGSPLGAVHSST
jgi:hypothetical protein